LVPQGSGLIENPTGPPGFFIGNVYVLAGIPNVMRGMLSSLQSKLTGGAVLQSRSVTAYLAESAIAKPLSELQEQHPAVEIGSYPFRNEQGFGTTLVMRGIDEKLLDIVVGKIEAMIRQVGEKA
jgi:molybdopterin-biosynthesis enzyme MoeA-like protein